MKGQPKEIQLPYERFVVDEEESFKLVSSLVLHNRGSGYTSFVQSFMFFTSPDKEVKISKSPVIKFFEDINTVAKFEALGLPIRKVYKCPDGTANVAYEIDLSQTRVLASVFKTKKFECLPFLWVYSVPS